MAGIGVAVVGTGFIGPVHVEALRRANVNVVGIADITLEQARSVADRLGVPKAYGSFEEVLADPDVHSVHLATPNKLHASQAKAVLESGRHVVCEKPLAMNSTESAELIEVAKRSGKQAAVNFNVRYYPICLEARARIAAGEMGRIYSVQGSYVQDWLLYDTDYNWRVLAEEGGALRAVGDIGSHWLDLLGFVTGLQVTEVCADLGIVHKVRRRPKGEVLTYSGKGAPPADQLEPIDIATEDMAGILLGFENGARGVLWLSQTTAGRKNLLRFEIAAEKGAFYWESERPNELWIGHRESPNEHLLRDPSLLGEAARGHAAYPGGHNEGFPDTFKQLYRAFYGAAQGNPSPFGYPTFEDGHRKLLLGEAILKSHQERRWVTVGE